MTRRHLWIILICESIVIGFFFGYLMLIYGLFKEIETWQWLPCAVAAACIVVAKIDSEWGKRKVVLQLCTAIPFLFLVAMIIHDRLL